MTVEKLKRRRGGEKCGATRGGFDTCSSWMQVPATKLTVWFAHISAFLFVAFFLSFIAFSSFLFYFMNPFFIFHVNQWTFIYSFNYFCVFFSEHQLVAEVLSVEWRSSSDPKTVSFGFWIESTNSKIFLPPTKLQSLNLYILYIFNNKLLLYNKIKKILI